MRKLILVILVLVLSLPLFASVAKAEETTFHWKVLRGSPRVAVPFKTAAEVAAWLLGKG